MNNSFCSSPVGCFCRYELVPTFLMVVTLRYKLSQVCHCKCYWEGKLSPSLVCTVTFNTSNLTLASKLVQFLSANFCVIAMAILVYVCPDKLLEEFSQQEGVWHFCVYFLRHSSNQHVLMYSLNILEVSLSVS